METPIVGTSESSKFIMNFGILLDRLLVMILHNFIVLQLCVFCVFPENYRKLRKRSFFLKQRSKCLFFPGFSTGYYTFEIAPCAQTEKHAQKTNAHLRTKKYARLEQPLSLLNNLEFSSKKLFRQFRQMAVSAVSDVRFDAEPASVDASHPVIGVGIAGQPSQVACEMFPLF